MSNKKGTYIKILDLLEVEKVTNKYKMYSFINTYTICSPIFNYINRNVVNVKTFQFSNQLHSYSVFDS